MTLLTVKDMATRLQVTDKTVYAWVSQGKIPCMKVNGIIRFDEQEMDRWFQQCHVRVGPPRAGHKDRPGSSASSVDHLIESAKRAVYTARGETSDSEPIGKGGAHGAR
jgi:excisionase family DNA binding protein